MPGPKDSHWTVFRRRILIIVYVLVAPEIVIAWAARQHFGARQLAKIYEGRGWTITHGFFIDMGGFTLHDEQGTALWILGPDELMELFQKGKIAWPSITEEEIQDRSKGDYLSKGIVLIQTTWFIVHCIVRRMYHLSTNEKHSDPIRNALKIFELDPRKFETIRPDITPPTYYKRVKATISSERKDAIEAEAKDEADYKIYTDGSEHDGRVGASAIIFRKGIPRAEKSLTFHLGNSSRYTVTDAELVGALLGIWLLRTTPGSARRTFSLYTDSQTAVRHLTKQYAGPGSHIVNAFRGYVDHALKINWIPGHSDIPGNTKADDLAHLAAWGQSSPIDNLPPLLRRSLPLSIEAERRNYGQEINTMWREHWQHSR